jgi:hypothetical protein
MSKGWSRFSCVLSLILALLSLFDFVSLSFFGNPHHVPTLTLDEWGLFGFVFLMVGISQLKNWR